MFNLILKDVIIQKKSVLVATVYIVFFMFVFQSMKDLMATSAIVAFTYILVMGAFAYDDKNKADIMLNSLPIRRKNVVLAKYISLYLFIGIGAIVYFIFFNLVFILNLPVNAFPLTLEGIAGAVFGVSLMNSIYFPLIFKVGYTRAKVFNFILFFSFFFGLPLLVNLIISNSNMGFLKEIFERINSQPESIIVMGIVLISMVMLSVSYFVSLKFYRAREF